MFLDVASGQTDWRDVYKLCIGFINPRPIALVSTIDAAGVANLAPFSFYNMVSGRPPVLMVCPSTRRDKTQKDTWRNIEESGEFVVAVVTESIAEPMVRCAADLPPGQSEFAFSGLTPQPARVVRAPLVRESPVNIECRLRQIVRFSTEPGAGCVIFGDIVALHVADWILGPDGAVDPHRLRTVGRLGGKWYCNVTEPYELDVPPATD